MSAMKQGAVATLIGDLVGSRGARDRSALHARFEQALAAVNEARSPLVPLYITAGDECQGSFAGVGEAAAAALRLRLELLPEADLRFGIGWGAVTVLTARPRVEDGPAWWAARAAIEAVATDGDRAALRWTRTAYRVAPDTAGPDEAAVNAALRLRDQLVGPLTERSLRLLDGLLRGETQVRLAEDLGITPSAVSQRIRSDGLAMIVAAEEDLEGVR